MAATPSEETPPGGVSARMRADKWLWHARFFKTRGLATELIAAGHLRVNGEKISKPAFQIGPGDVLTFPQARLVRVVRISLLSVRRGPASEAQTLYEDLSPPQGENDFPPNMGAAPKFDGKGRPTKKDRRNLMKSGQPPLD
ncbi:Heat shock protein 15 [Aliiroseovarius sp. xm-m-379]|nr:Heat shock protein 15 [Aliiroseovarius sp. xm-d-517]NRP25305.1 Heat shock protein 15 [Aliiroseovarius sp. xm-m-379]NRP30967.1 Heat shock protein 15 [Aliiroseovarius sp. xm-m-314]NRP34104.1 Heat shock protein 15 [Aliiroseovarius sp. xm-a-104]NRP41429.1 Heat shock protein 15 [Aliiroseovarius sp. xm-m-339-2]NRP44781.1 Heat shock protein 15 [Aliiroseovarius sp. xm-m-378]NRP50717.1 Heat shock protein 15 [Aliiroseovarius sp. xm-m-354]NRP62435.1 Heat shock protein 15 [Aliiroseovarius sp. xm-a-15